MAPHDEHLPADLRDIAERLTESRVTFTPLELDALNGRLRTRFQRAPRRRGLVTRLRMSSVAGLVAVGLMLTTGVGAVLACTSLGGGGNSYGGDPFHGVFQTTSFHHERDASFCQYRGPITKVIVIHTPRGILIITITIFCGHVHVHITFIGPFGFRFGHDPFDNIRGSSCDTDAPDGATSLTVNAGGSSYNVPFE